MRKNIAKVIAAFERGVSCIGDSKRTCWTDGDTIYSYRMPIAQRMKTGAIHVVTYDAAPTRTTKSQVHALHVHFDYAKHVDAIDPNYRFRSLAGDSGYQDRFGPKSAPLEPMPRLRLVK